MGDRCYMRVTCPEVDKARFEELGFHLEFQDHENSSVVEMVDEEANYAHYEEMPTDIVYYGTWDAGSEYGPGKLVCDGKDYEELPATSDGFVLTWNYRWGVPKLKSILAIRRYLRLERKVQKLFRSFRDGKVYEHLFLPGMRICLKCGQVDTNKQIPCIK